MFISIQVKFHVKLLGFKIKESDLKNREPNETDEISQIF